MLASHRVFRHRWSAPAAALLVLLAVPAGALGHGAGLGAGDAARNPYAAGIAADRQAEALASLPRAGTDGECTRTREVDGLGDACRTADGLFRIELASGGTISTHGADAPGAQHTAAASLLPDSQAAVDGASAADIECVTAPGDQRIELVYAYPANKPNRIATVEPQMRQAIYQASAFVDAESQSQDPDQGRRLRVLCSGGVPVVNVAQVRAVGSGGEQFGNVVDDLVGQGYPEPVWNSPSPRRFMVFYDAPHAGGAAGVGDLWGDDGLTSDNLNNLGARYASEFAWSMTQEPHWDVFLHEMTHNMGGVADGAPDSSLAGHCFDGYDTMCYEDGGTAPGGYTTTQCAQERYDCGGDTYFDPSPDPGEWLANHWNVGSTLNAFLEPRDTGWDDGGVPDNDAPTAVSGLTATPAFTSVSLSWGTSTDARSTVRYRVYVDRKSGGSWSLDSTSPPLSSSPYSVTGLAAGTAYRFRVRAYDRAGNETADAVVESSTSSGPPTAPASLTLVLDTATSISASWPAGDAVGGVRGYQLQVAVQQGGWFDLGEVKEGPQRLVDLDSGTSYQMRIRTVGNDARTSSWRSSASITTAGTLAGGGGDGAPPSPVVTAKARGATGALVTWTTTTGAERWDVRIVDAGGRTAQLLEDVRATNAVVNRLRPGARYTAQVVAYAAGSETASAAGLATFTTERDTKRPGVVKLSGRPKVAGSAARFAWLAAKDDIGVERYEVQRKVGARWVKVAHVGTGVRGMTVRGLKARSVTALRIRAVDQGGNAGVWTTFAIRRR